MNLDSLEIKRSSFDLFNENTPTEISMVLKGFYEPIRKPVIVCIGSDLVLGDSLGPLVGTLLKKKGVNAYVYGSLSMPVTAKEISHLKSFLKKVHPKSFVLAVDAAVGDLGEVGKIKAYKKGLKPGLGVNKNLGEMGDCSIIGIVAEKSKSNKKLFSFTRLNLVYKMAEQIACGLEEYLTFKPNYNFL